VPSFPSRSAYITTLGSLAILEKTSDFNIDSTWSFLSSTLVNGDSYRLSQGSFPELKYLYIGSSMPLQLAFPSSGTLVGLGEWPGFLGFRANALGVALVSQSVSPLNTTPYRFVGQTCRGNQCDGTIKGTLQALGGTLLACPEASIVTETCTGLLRANFTSGGPLWNSQSGAESLIIAANGMLSYRKCSGTVSQYQCTTLMGVAASEANASFVPLIKSIGDNGINVGDYSANNNIANLLSSTVPGVLTTPTSGVYVIQNKTGDYITYGSCPIPDDCIDYKRYPLFMARSVMRELIEQFKAQPQGVRLP
jgi:hypothetical protein